MIDMHSHYLPFIDDGSPNLDESYKMLDKAVEIGITDIIFTPHALRVNIKKYNKADLFKIYNDFLNLVKDRYKINFYLGQEISYHHDLVSKLHDAEVLSMNDSDYILLELPFDAMIEDFEDLIYSINTLGKKIVVAHIERYPYLSFKDILNLSTYPLLFQVNSSSITGTSGKDIQKLTMKLFKNSLVTLVSSDVHSFRHNEMKSAYQMISKKFGEGLAEDVFRNNARTLFNLKNNS